MTYLDISLIESMRLVGDPPKLLEHQQLVHADGVILLDLLSIEATLFDPL